MDAEPKSLRFRHNLHGKPILIGSDGDEPLSFNVSHSGSLALYAITKRRRVGIDVERMRDDLSHEEVSKRFFSPTERAMLQALPPKSSIKAFFDCWTKKEAYAKGRGEGLSLAFDQFSVAIGPTRSMELIENRVHPADVSLWSLVEIDPGPGYAGAIAVEGHDWNTAFFDVPRNRESGRGTSAAPCLPRFPDRTVVDAHNYSRGGAVVARSRATRRVRETESQRGA
jgi:4'-phosphopantetheinyl transferase